jgi:lipopolysaccharide transport system permease protein
MPPMTEARPENVTVIEPARGWRGLGLREAWEYRELLYFLIWREVKSRYRQMALGPLWIVLIPLINTVVFSVIFGGWAGMPHGGVPAPVYYFAALLPWQFFSVSASKAARSLVDNLNLISKVYFPRIIVPASCAVVGLLDCVISFALLLAIMAWYHIALAATSFLLPAYLLLALMTALAVGLWLAALAVWFRDVAYGVAVLMQIWMFATVIYPSGGVPAQWRLLYRLNPMQTVVEGFRWCLLGCGQPPDAVQAVAAAAVIVALAAGAYVFQRTERTVVDVL